MARQAFQKLTTISCYHSNLHFKITYWCLLTTAVATQFDHLKKKSPIEIIVCSVADLHMQLGN